MVKTLVMPYNQLHKRNLNNQLMKQVGTMSNLFFRTYLILTFKVLHAFFINVNNYILVLPLRIFKNIFELYIYSIEIYTGMKLGRSMIE